MPAKKDPAPNLTPEKPGVFTEENRKRALELILVRGTSNAIAISYAVEKWKMTADKAQAWILEIRQAWREEWNNSDTRIDERLRGIQSLKSVVKELHEIIHSTKTIQVPAQSGGTTPRKVWAYEPRIRMEAMSKLVRVEEVLSGIVGYGVADVPLPPPAAPTPVPAITSEEAPGTVSFTPPARTLGRKENFTEFFIGLKGTVQNPEKR